MQSNPAGSTQNPVDLKSEWLDLYSILDIAPDADSDAIRKRISTRTSEAVGNSNHRDSKRREYYQALSQQLLPQCRRVLLDPAFRAAYDQQRHLHATGAPDAIPYKAFLSTLSEAGMATAGLDAGGAAVTSTAAATEVAPSIPVAAEVESFPVTPPGIPDLEVSTASGATSTAAVSNPAVEPQQHAAGVESADEEDDEPALIIISKDKPLLTPIGEPASEKTAAAPTARKPALRLPQPSAKASPRNAGPSNPAPGAATTRPAPIAPNQFVTPVAPQKRISYSYAPRVVIGEDAAAAARNQSGLFRPGERALSDTSIALLTAIVATMLSITIDLFSEPGTFVLSATLLFMLPRVRIRCGDNAAAITGEFGHGQRIEKR